LEEIGGFFAQSELESMGGDHEFSDTPRRHRFDIDLRGAPGRAIVFGRSRNARLGLSLASLQPLK